MNRGEAFGLWYMLAALAITLGVLGYDGWAYFTGHQTISDRIWLKLQAWRYSNAAFPWWSLVLPFGMSQQAVGLIVHFVAGMYRGMEGIR